MAKSIDWGRDPEKEKRFGRLATQGNELTDDADTFKMAGAMAAAYADEEPLPSLPAQKPDDVSDLAWKRMQWEDALNRQDRQQRKKAGVDPDGVPVEDSFLNFEKPEGVSEEDWRKAREKYAQAYKDEQRRALTRRDENGRLISANELFRTAPPEMRAAMFGANPDLSKGVGDQWNAR